MITPPLCGASCPPCTSWISLMNDGAAASLPFLGFSYWCLSMPPYTLVAHQLLLIALCCSSLGFPCYVLLILVRTSLLCYASAHRCLHAMFYLCSLAFPYYVRLVFIGTSLCLVGACCCVLVMLYWCLSMCLCYVLLVLVDAFMLCFIVVHWHLLATFPDLQHLMYFSNLYVHYCSLVLPCCVLLVLFEFLD